MGTHGEALRAATGDDAFTEQIRDDYRNAQLDARTRAMLDYAVTITANAHGVTFETIEDLRRSGLSDEDVLETAQIAALFNFYNRLADSLGVEHEDFVLERNPTIGQKR